MPRRLPPFTAPLAFEAAAGHLSGELCVAQSAISRRIRGLAVGA